MDADDLAGLARAINVAIGLALALILTLAAVASIMVTRRTVGRIESINATSRAIMQTGLGRRIELRGTHDEWDELAANLNSMLDRIEILLRQVKQVTDNVAHDLRTPLARMRGRLERAYNRPRANEADQSLIGDTLADLDGVLHMFGALLRISQIEAADSSAALRPVDLAPIASEIAELFDAAAEEKKMKLACECEQNVMVVGDRDLLFDALINLVDNAIKHGREGGQVRLEVKNSEQGALVSVADDGPGIPADEINRVFDRFYRLERSRGSPGHGLGLSLVTAVAHLHAARIEMADHHPGLIVQIRFPPMAESQPGD
jgi:signal transduction histidine kinase